jgi:hypothetical protein
VQEKSRKLGQIKEKLLQELNAKESLTEEQIQEIL